MPVDIITKEQQSFYDQHKGQLINKYLKAFPKRIDPDTVRDLFMPIGYNRNNVELFKGICKILTEDIYQEALKRNRLTVKTVIFAAGLPATGKSTHLETIAGNELIYDGTVNNEDKFIQLVERALDMEYTVDVFVYSADPARAFKSNLERGDRYGRYVPVSHYEKVANSINNRATLLKQKFQNKVRFRNFEHTGFEGRPKRFSQIKIDRNELERIATEHQFNDSKALHRIIS